LTFDPCGRSSEVSKAVDKKQEADKRASSRFIWKRSPDKNPPNKEARMDRMSKRLEPITDERVTHLFQRTLALWAGDLLRQSARIEWAAPEPVSDYRDRNWKSLYEGNVVDD